MPSNLRFLLTACGLAAGMLICGVIALVLRSIPAQADTISDARSKLATLAPEARHELLEKKERFDKFPDPEKARLRELHTSIAQSPDAPRLTTTLQRYHQWLMTLSPLQRDELVSLPQDKRIARIKEIQQEQQQQRFRDLAGKLPPEDFEAIQKWLERFIAVHEARLVEQMVEPFKSHYEGLPPDEKRRRRQMFAWAVINPRQPHLNPLVTASDYEELITLLSPAARKEIQGVKDPSQKEQVLCDWVRAAVKAKLSPQVSDEQLREFRQQLKVAEREGLEKLPPEQMWRELRRMYFEQKFRQERGGPFGPPREGAGFGEGRPPRDGQGGFRPGSDDPRRGGNQGKGFKGRRSDDRPPPEGPPSTERPPPPPEEKPEKSSP